MSKKINKTDIIFTVALILGLLFHISTIFFLYINHDETFYLTTPLRLINGEYLIQHEWHLSQFSSLFSYLPVRVFTMINGSTDGIVVAMRCVYILLHTAVSVWIYRFFKEYDIWGVAAAMMFYIQVPYAIYAISYHSTLAIFVLLFTFCLVSAVKDNLPKRCILAGFCYGACCVCNPTFALFFAVYTVLCILWLKKDSITKKISEILSAKSKKHQFFSEDLACIQSYDNICGVKAFLFSLAGVCIMAIICIVFFFLTGGRITSVVENLENLINSSEYEVVENSLVLKLQDIFEAWSAVSLKMPFLLPILLVGIAFDKKRLFSSHRIIYILLAFAVSWVYVLGIFKAETSNAYIFSLPFAVFSMVCYILTEKKNKILFYCMWCVCVVGACVHGMVSNTLLTSAGVVLSVANVLGVIFVGDMFRELKTKIKWKKDLKEDKLFCIGRTTICLALCLQMLLYGIAIYSFKDLANKTILEREGTFSGILLSQSQHSKYEKILNDLDTIKAQSNQEDPVLFISSENWMYIYADRPFATYTAWNQARFDSDSLKSFYCQNNDKLPRFIYIPKAEVTGDYYYSEDRLENVLIKAEELFIYKKEELPGGFLLTVTEHKFDITNKSE